MRHFTTNEQLKPWQAMRPYWVLAREIETRVAGVTHVNPDGTSRQRILQRLNPHARADLRREPRNPVDENAIAVMSRLGQVGYLATELAEDLAPAVDAGRVRLRGQFRDVGAFQPERKVIWYALIAVYVHEREYAPAFSLFRFFGWGVRATSRAVGRVGLALVMAVDRGMQRIAGADGFLLWTLRAVVVLSIIGAAVALSAVL